MPSRYHYGSAGRAKTADVGHYELIGKGVCAGVDVLGEIQSHAVLGQEVRGMMSTRGSMWVL